MFAVTDRCGTIDRRWPDWLPDPDASRRHAIACLCEALTLGEGFIVLTGDPQTTTSLIAEATGPLDRASLNRVTIAAPDTTDDLLRAVCGGVGVLSTGMTAAQMLRAIEHGLHAVAREGRRTLLIVLDAQVLPIAALETLATLSSALIQIVLIGSPTLRDRLTAPSLVHLRARVIADYHLDPMEVPAVTDPMTRRPADEPTPPAARMVRPFLIEQAPPATDELLLTDRLYLASELPTGASPAIVERIAAIERRLEDQDDAMRRLLTLLIDLSEAGNPVARRAVA